MSEDLVRLYAEVHVFARVVRGDLTDEQFETFGRAAEEGKVGPLLLMLRMDYARGKRKVDEFTTRMTNAADPFLATDALPGFREGAGLMSATLFTARHLDELWSTLGPAAVDIDFEAYVQQRLRERLLRYLLASRPYTGCDLMARALHESHMFAVRAILRDYVGVE